MFELNLLDKAKEVKNCFFYVSFYIKNEQVDLINIYFIKIFYKLKNRLPYQKNDNNQIKY